jgi:hypothetical protein
MRFFEKRAQPGRARTFSAAAGAIQTLVPRDAADAGICHAGVVLNFWLELSVTTSRRCYSRFIRERAAPGKPRKPRPSVGMSPARRLKVADQYVDRLLISKADRLYGENLTDFQLPFNFHLISAPWTPATIAGLIELYEQALHAH